MKTHPKSRPFPSLSRLTGLLLIAAALFQSGCRGQDAHPPAEPGPLPPQSFRRDWRTDLDLEKDRLRSLHVRENSIYAYTRSGQVASLKRDSGALEFIVKIDGGNTTLHPPVVLPEHVAFTTATTVQTYTPDGRFVRTSRLPFAVRSAAAGYRTFLYMGADYPQGGARVAKVDITQEYVPVSWSFLGLSAGRDGFSAAPAVVEDIVYIGGTDGYVYAIAATNRERIWPIPDGVFKTSGAIVADIAADASGVYVASTDSVLYALNRNNGHRRWQYFTGVPLRNAPVATSDRVYILVEGKGLAALSKDPVNEQEPAKKYNRQPLWIASDARQFLAQDEKYAYVRGKDNRIVALDKTTGEEKFRSKRRDFAFFATNTSNDGTIFAATRDGSVIAIKPVLQPGMVGELVLNERPLWEAKAVAVR